MAIDFTNATGNLFNRIGQVATAFCGVNTYRNTTLPGLVDGVQDQYNDNRELIPDLQNVFESAQDSAGDINDTLADSGEQTVIEMVDDDNPLTEKTIEPALIELIRQMNAGSETVNASVVGSSVTADAGNNGNGTVIVSLIDGKGQTLENVYGEDIIVECTSDSQPRTGNTVEGRELFRARGEESVDKFDREWPKGSGGSTGITSADAAQNNTASNRLTNSNFENFTTNAPDNWNIITGTAGTTIDDTTTSYRGTNALAIIGTGAAELTKISQTLRDTANATAGDIKPETRYLISARVSVSSVPVAGVLRISLKDGTGGAANVVGGASIDVTLSGESTSYALHTAQISTPAPLTAGLYMVIEMTTAVDSGVTVRVDEVTLTEMVQHQNGPFFAVVPGETKFLIGDKFTATITNDRGGKFQEWFNRLFDMDTRGLLLPSNGAGGETISDSLITC